MRGKSCEGSAKDGVVLRDVIMDRRVVLGNATEKNCGRSIAENKNYLMFERARQV